MNVLHAIRSPVRETSDASSKWSVLSCVSADRYDRRGGGTERSALPAIGATAVRGGSCSRRAKLAAARLSETIAHGLRSFRQLGRVEERERMLLGLLDESAFVRDGSRGAPGDQTGTSCQSLVLFACPLTTPFAQPPISPPISVAVP